MGWRFLFIVLWMAQIFFIGCAPTHFIHTNGVWFRGSNPIVWEASRFPLGVSFDESLDREDRQAMLSAIETWNARIGVEVFIQSDSADDVRFTQRSDVASRTPGMRTFAICTTNELNGIYRHATITIDSGTNPSEAVPVLIHELGHSLGLQHDSYQLSVMYPNAVVSGGSILEDDASFVRWEMMR